MSKSPKVKTRGANVPVPQSRDEAASFIHEIGVRQREIARIEADMNDRIAQAKKDAEATANPLSEQVDRLTEGLRIWADANRQTLTGGKRKFADLGTGKIEWRLTPAKVTIRNVEDVIARIKTLSVIAFLRTKDEIDKEAMLRDPAKARLIAGVSIGAEGERFYVEPFEAEIKGAAE